MKVTALAWLRLIALLYDALPILALWMLMGALALALTNGQLDPRHPPLLYQMALLNVTAAYFIISWVRGGQTIGMRAWRLKLISINGNVTSKQAVLRFVVACLSLTIGGLGFIWAFFDPQGRTWHDLATDTRLIRLAKS